VDVLDHSAELCNGDAQRTPEILYILDEILVSSSTVHVFTLHLASVIYKIAIWGFRRGLNEIFAIL
jgi:hypothetical protein